jgi:hypothetical protein
MLAGFVAANQRLLMQPDKWLNEVVAGMNKRGCDVALSWCILMLPQVGSYLLFLRK